MNVVKGKGGPATMRTMNQRLELGHDERLAYAHHDGALPEVVFLPGFRSDMTGTKAVFLETQCRAKARAYTRFDYRGHGASSGRFEEGTISAWLDDTLAILDRVVGPRFVLVGSSMGGWLALLAGLCRAERTAGLVLVAPAPDFTSRLLEPAFTAEQRTALERDGGFPAPSIYGEPIPITRRLIEDGRRHRLLGADIPITCPVHILHGQRDPDVPWRLSLELAARLRSDAVTVELIEDGDHRLSREDDLKRLAAAVDRVVRLAAGES